MGELAVIGFPLMILNFVHLGNFLRNKTTNERFKQRSPTIAITESGKDSITYL